MMVKFGDGVEIYLPGVITQKVSCELGLSSLQEGWLAIVIYVFQGIAVFSAVKLASWMGKGLLCCTRFTPQSCLQFFVQ